MPEAAPITTAIESRGNPAGAPITVTIDHRVVGLLSDQLYQSPLKAVEELVVNAYDADASTCRVSVPVPGFDQTFVAVFDDGTGMDQSGLDDLWSIGESRKRDAEVEAAAKRRLIGKFGIGKLATRAIAKHVTHITRQQAEVLAVSVDYDLFEKGGDDTHELEVVQINDS